MKATARGQHIASGRAHPPTLQGHGLVRRGRVAPFPSTVEREKGPGRYGPALRLCPLVGKGGRKGGPALGTAVSAHDVSNLSRDVGGRLWFLIVV